jgi:hypothetical protein
MKYFLFFVLAFACTNSAAQDTAAVSPQNSSTAGSSIQFSGGDGSSIDQAVVIENAKGEDDGVEAEYTWVRDKYPGFKFEGQGIITKGEKIYDRLEGTKADGTKAGFFFDITLFFGKF